MNSPHGGPVVPIVELAAPLAHELNNIAAALSGFVGLACEAVQPDSPAAAFMREIRVGVSRLAELAVVIETLAEVQTSRTRTELTSSLGPLRLTSNAVSPMHWNCPPSTAVMIHQDGLVRALHLLAVLTRAEATDPQPPALEATVDGLVAGNCWGCGAPLPAAALRISVVPGDATRFIRRGGLESGMRAVTLAAWQHAVHVAGGHSRLERDGLPTILVPIVE